MSDVCVVCGAVIGDTAVFPNAWEATVKQRVCCSAACKDRFDLDVHWLPSRLPPPASPMDEGRLTSEAQRRLARGDAPVPIARELLCAGVPLSAIDHVLRMGEVRDGEAAGRAAGAASGAALVGAVTAGPLAALWALLRGDAQRRRAAAARDARRDAARGAVAAWQACWSLPSP